MKVQCQICKAEFMSINSMHLAKHGLTVGKYHEMFPMAALTSDETKNNRSQALIGREIMWKDKIASCVKQAWDDGRCSGRTGVQLNEMSRESLSKKMMGHPVSDETRKKISASGLGRSPWNKGLDKGTDPRMMSISKKASINSANSSPETRAKISATLKKKYSDGMKIPHSKTGFRHDLQMSFRSTWEANYARILVSSKKKFGYETRRFTLTENGIIVSVYVADFDVDGKIVEVKGHAVSAERWDCQCSRCIRDKRKMSLLERQYNVRPEIIGKKEYAELKSRYSGEIREWE